MNIFFDLDGTLFQTELCTVNAISKLCQEHNFSQPSKQKIRSCIGKTTNEFLQSLLPQTVVTEQIRECYRSYEQTEVSERGILFPEIHKMLSDVFQLYTTDSGST